MNYKNIFANTLLVVLLAVPGYAFSAPMPNGPVEGESSGFYAAFNYTPSAENFGDIEVLEPVLGKVFGIKQTANSISNIDNTTAEPYNPKYQNGFLGGNVALGYAMGDARIEIAGNYIKFDIEDKDFTHKEFAKTVIVADTVDRDVRSASGLEFNNGGITNISIMMNAYYDIVNEGSPVAPYIGAGIGMDMIKFFEKTKYSFAYQGKAGISYSFNPQFSVIGGIYYHGVIGDDFKEMKGEIIGKKDYHIRNTVKFKMPYAHYGLEVGIRFNFN